MRSLFAAIAAFAAAAPPAIDVERVRSDAACELVYCTLTAADSVHPPRKEDPPPAQPLVPEFPESVNPSPTAAAPAPPAVRTYYRPRRFRR